MSEPIKSTMELETKEYLQTVMKGFVWIFMFIVSIVAMFLIFKTPYYQYYKDKSPLQLNSKGEIIPQSTNHLSPSNNPALKFSNKVNEDMLQDFSNTANKNEYSLNLSDNFDNTKLVNDEDLKINKKDSDSKKFLKQTKKVSKQNADRKITENTSTSRENRLKKELANNKNSSANNSALTKLLQDSSKKTQTPVMDSSTANKAIVNSNKSVWLVNIYSSSNKNTLKGSFNNLKNKYPILKNSSVYFTEFFKNNGKFYRISVAQKAKASKQNAYYNTRNQANNFCITLKSQGLDCFVSSVFLPSLSKYAIK